ncbi:MAG: hypothetical protein HY319_14825 [Armatimonadetes bacterium]|nr:hypothetical protein [Armatimonadota bacterium]
MLIEGAGALALAAISAVMFTERKGWGEASGSLAPTLTVPDPQSNGAPPLTTPTVPLMLATSPGWESHWITVPSDAAALLL